jgi:hypothetical protein
MGWKRSRSKVTPDSPGARMVMSSDNPMAKDSKNGAR